MGLLRLPSSSSSHSSLARLGKEGLLATWSISIYRANPIFIRLTVPWLYPAEIFPLAVRSKGNAWGVVGWSIGNGWLVLLCPVMFANIIEKTFYIFGACNVITIPMVWALYPESNQRTLEEMDLLFASDSIWNWEAEKNYKRLVEENPQIVQAAKRSQSVVDPETGRVGARRSSYAAVYGAESKNGEKVSSNDEKGQTGHL